MDSQQLNVGNVRKKTLYVLCKCWSMVHDYIRMLLFILPKYLCPRPGEPSFSLSEWIQICGKINYYYNERLAVSGGAIEKGL